MYAGWVGRAVVAFSLVLNLEVTSVVNIQNLGAARREYPNWAMRGRLKKVDDEGNVLDAQSACGGEMVRISPRFQRNGQHYRIRPERPAAFFAAFLHESGVLPTALTPEECDEPWALELLDPLWEQYKGHFYKLESPFAACDGNTVPSHRLGFSFNVPQILVDHVGTVKSNGPRPLTNKAVSVGPANSSVADAIRKRIEEMRARTGKAETTAPAKKK